VFGNSLYVWGALIGVILAAMSSGYAFGGWISDRRPGGKVLAGLLLVSGAWTFLVAWIGQAVLFRVAGATEDPRWGPCLAAAVLLAPPAFGLSGVLPAMLRLAVSDLDHLGRHTGRMIALSTMGSLAGTWGTAFFFLSWIGSHALVAWLGVIQAALGFWWLLKATGAKPLTVIVCALLVGGAGAGAGHAPARSVALAARVGDRLPEDVVGGIGDLGHDACRAGVAGRRRGREPSHGEQPLHERGVREQAAALRRGRRGGRQQQPRDGVGRDRPAADERAAVQNDGGELHA